MKPASKPRKRSEAPRLNRDDWLDAAFKAVVEGGFDNVRVLVIADALGVTRGSFYWHFADHAELVSALLARWKEREIAIDQKLQSQSTADPQADCDCSCSMRRWRTAAPIWRTFVSSWPCAASDGATRPLPRCWWRSMKCAWRCSSPSSCA